MRIDDKDVIAYSDEFYALFLQRKPIIPHNEMKMWEKKSVTLSVIIICGNEEKNILNCLNSIMVQEVDEIIIVDTGSTDKTRSIVEEFARSLSIVQIHYIDWKEDFSMVRNYGMDKANSDWVFFLDADEKIVNHQRKSLKEYIAYYSEKYGCDFGIAPVIKNSSTNILYNNPRIFCKQAGYQYYGNVHETLRKTKNYYQFIPFLSIDIRIEHTGYVENIIQKKLERNIKLLEQNMKTEPDNPLWCCYKLRDGRNAIKIEEKISLYNKVLSMKKEKISPFYYTFCFDWSSILIIEDLIEKGNLILASKIMRNIVSEGGCSTEDIYYLKTKIEIAEIEQRVVELEQNFKRKRKNSEFQSSMINTNGFHYDEIIMRLLKLQHKMAEYYKYKDYLLSQDYFYEVRE